MKRLSPLLAALLLTLASARALADPTPVTVGIYVNQIHELSLKENYFTADFYVWFRWRGDELKPYETFAVTDGRVESKGEVSTKKIGDESYAYVRIVAKITKFWNISKYPFDTHDLVISVEEEESEDHLLVYVPDTQNFGVDPRLSVPGWHIVHPSLVIQTATYASNFGDTSIPTGKVSRYARAVGTLGLAREAATFFAKTFFALWVAAATAFLAFFIKPTNVDPRFGLGVGAIFAAVASEYVVTGELPETNVVTLADRLHIVAFAFIFITVAQSTWSLWVYENGKEELSKRADRLCATLVPLVYAALNVLVVIFR